MDLNGLPFGSKSMGKFQNYFFVKYKISVSNEA